MLVSLRRAVLLALALSVAAVTVTAEERVLNEADLPPSVLVTFRSSYPGATIHSVSEEMEDGITYYEISSVQDTVRRSILYTREGNVVLIEQAVGVADLPRQSAEAVVRRFPGATLEAAEMVTRGAVTSYEVTLRSGRQKFEVSVTTDGQITDIEEETLLPEAEANTDDEME